MTSNIDIYNYVDKVYVINMEKDKKRLEEVKKKCYDNKIVFERFEGINPSNLDNDIYNNNTTLFCKLFTPKSAIGCSLSHIFLWKKIVKNNIKKCLILEDDAIFKNNFYEILDSAYKELHDNEWDILFLTGCYYHSKYIEKIKIFKKNIYIPELICTTSAYILTLEGAKKLLKYINKANYHIDFDILTTNFYRNDLKIYSIKPSIVYQDFTDKNSNNITKYKNDIYNFPVIIDKFINSKDKNNNFIEYGSISYIYNLKIINIFNIDISFNILLVFMMGILNYPFFLLYFLYEKYYYDLKYTNIYFLVLTIGLLFRLTIFSF